jgi:hypothetical protein
MKNLQKRDIGGKMKSTKKAMAGILVITRVFGITKDRRCGGFFQT